MFVFCFQVDLGIVIPRWNSTVEVFFVLESLTTYTPTKLFEKNNRKQWDQGRVWQPNNPNTLCEKTFQPFVIVCDMLCGKHRETLPPPL